MSRIYNQLNVYLDGNMIAFFGDGEFIFSRSRGQIDVQPEGSNGLSFMKVTNREQIAAVRNFNDVLDQSGTPYGATIEDTITALNQFLGFNTGGGGGTTDYVQDVQFDGVDSLDFTGVGSAFSGSVNLGALGENFLNADLSNEDDPRFHETNQNWTFENIQEVLGDDAEARLNLQLSEILDVGGNATEALRAYFDAVSNADGSEAFSGVEAPNDDPSAAFAFARKFDGSDKLISRIYINPDDVLIGSFFSSSGVLTSFAFLRLRGADGSAEMEATTFEIDAARIESRIEKVNAATITLDETHYQVVAKQNTTITLPLAPTEGTTYEIYANSFNVTIQTQGADQIVDNSGLALASTHSLTNYSSVIVKYLDTNTYLIV